MKKLIYTLITCLFLVSCGTSRNIEGIRAGMNQQQVNAILGAPNRVLSMGHANSGFVEVLEYETYRGEVYAVQYVDGLVTGYDFLYQEQNIAPGRPGYPHNNRPNVIINNNRPNGNRPGGNNNSNNRPNGNNNNRPNGNNNSNNRPETGNNRPNENNRPPQTKEEQTVKDVRVETRDVVDSE